METLLNLSLLWEHRGASFDPSNVSIMCFHLLGRPLSLQVPSPAAPPGTRRAWPRTRSSHCCSRLLAARSCPGSAALPGARRERSCAGPRSRGQQRSAGPSLFVFLLPFFPPSRPSVLPLFGRAVHRRVGRDGRTRCPTRGVWKKRELGPWARCSQGYFPT